MAVGPQGTHVRVRCGWTRSGVGIIEAMGVVRSHVSVGSAPSMWLLSSIPHGLWVPPRVPPGRRPPDRFLRPLYA
ncbi:unnamed protein product [Musa hybrid cultivar]